MLLRKCVSFFLAVTFKRANLNIDFMLNFKDLKIFEKFKII